MVSIMKGQIVVKELLAPVLAPGLIAYDWLDNARELGKLIERALIQHCGGVLSFETLLPLYFPRNTPRFGGSEEPVPPSLEEMNAHHVN
jgi:transcriptional regulator with AAA-type ATPase domain